jgi:hypothetical protein
MRDSKQRKPIHWAVHFPGVDNTTVWSGRASGSQIELRTEYCGFTVREHFGI